MAVVVDREGKRRLWIGSLDHQSALHMVPNVEGYHPHLGSSGELYFASYEEAPKLYRVHADGTGMERVKGLGDDVQVWGLSPDSLWVVTWDPPGRLVAVPTGGGSPMPIILNLVSFGWPRIVVCRLEANLHHRAHHQDRRVDLCHTTPKARDVASDPAWRIPYSRRPR